MANITAQMVKELRESTGAGMMDCKAALTETGGDMQGAQEWLRKKGLSKAAKKAGRIAAEGLIGVTVAGSKGVVVEVNSETDFVARNDLFQGLVKMIANVWLTAGPDAASRPQPRPAADQGREGCAGRQIPPAGQAGKHDREDRRVRIEDLLQGSLPARAGFHLRRQEVGGAVAERGRRQGRRRDQDRRLRLRWGRGGGRGGGGAGGRGSSGGVWGAGRGGRAASGRATRPPRWPPSPPPPPRAARS